MNDILLINQIFVFLNLSIGLVLAFWVFLVNRKEKTNQIFLVMTALMLLWIIFAFLGFSSEKTGASLIWYRLNSGVVVLFFIAAYFFSIYFPKKVGENQFLTKPVIVLCSIIFFLSVFSNLIIQGVTEEEWGMEIFFGSGKLFYYIPIFFLTILILWNLLTKYFILSKKERLKIQYVLIGIIIYALANVIFNVGFTVLTGSVQFQHLGDYSAIFFLGFTAFAVVRRQLFGIKVVLTALLVTLIAILLLLDALIFTQDLLLQIVKGITFFAFLFFGYYLIRSVQLEIKRREEVEKLSSQLRVTNIQLDKLSKSKSEFISIASHQLRTPLTAVKGYISMMMERIYGKPPEKMKKPLENVYNSNERLIKLVNDLLNLSRLDAGKIEFNPELTSLKDMVSSIVEELKINAENKGLYIKTEKPSEPVPEIMADRGKLRQVILNIVDNAIKYTRGGGITLELKKLDGEAQIMISDTGEGMSKEELDNLFQMFSRATAGTQLHTEGAGIGLYVARQFVEMHKGRIWADSEGKGKGSVFTIQLPIKLNLESIKEKNEIITKSLNE